MKFLDVSVDQLDELIASPDLAVLDLRDRQSYTQGHLPGAIQADDNVITRFISERQYDRPVLIYCYHGHMSRDLAELFAFRGFRRVFNLEGGWQAWMEYRAHGDLPDDNNEFIQWLKQYGFDPENLRGTARHGMSPLMIAALKGDQDIVKNLLQHGAEINQLNDDHNNALWFACVGDNMNIARTLIAHGIDINNQNVNGATCLIYAASAGKSDLVSCLVEAGADLHRKTLDDFSALDSATTLPILNYLKPKYA